MPRDAQYWIDHLGLSPHPEGGYYRVTYTSDLNIAENALPAGFHGARSAATAIYFLIAGNDFSAFHRIASDEGWHFYSGGGLVVYVINPNGECEELHLGSDPDEGEVFQGVVRGGCWFASRLKDPASFALVGCTVAPGFDFADFELATRGKMVSAYPQHRRLIEEMTRV